MSLIPVPDKAVAFDAIAPKKTAAVAGTDNWSAFPSLLKLSVVTRATLTLCAATPRLSASLFRQARRRLPARHQ